jgi:DNA-binding beta-propeller fold protein YncE
VNSIMRRIVKWTLWTVTVAALIACGILFRLVYIGRPDDSTSLKFRGFVLLPKGALLTVLDYLTLSGQQLFVTDESTGSVYRITLHGEALSGSSDVAVFPSEPAAHGVALNQSKTLAYVTRSEVNAVDVFDPHTLKVIMRVPVADGPDAIVLDPTHNLLYVANAGARLATLIDPESHTVVATIPLAGKPEFPAVDQRTGLIFQNLRDANALAEVDITARSVKRTTLLPDCSEPTGMAIDEAGRRLFIACSGNAVLKVFDLDTRRIVATEPIGAGPDSVAFDSELHRIYTTGKAGVLTVVLQRGPDSYKVVESIKLHYGAHTLAIDPATHNLYVGYASLLVPARVAVFAAAGLSLRKRTLVDADQAGGVPGIELLDGMRDPSCTSSDVEERASRTQSRLGIDEQASECETRFQVLHRLGD